jgi:hypothetical protein
MRRSRGSAAKGGIAVAKATACFEWDGPIAMQLATKADSGQLQLRGPSRANTGILPLRQAQGQNDGVEA